MRCSTECIQTADAKPWNLLAPDPRMLDWEVIALSLSRICRWTGHTRFHYSVAQHSLEVAKMLPPSIQIYGLLHDAHEFAIGDKSSPYKRALAAISKEAGQALKLLTELNQAAIMRQAGLGWPVDPLIQREVDHADLTMLATERRDVMAGHIPWAFDAELPPPKKERIGYMPAGTARRKFLEAIQRWI